MATRVEESLCRDAPSLDAYSDASNLEQRLQQLSTNCQQQRLSEKKKRGGSGGWNSYNVYKSYTKHCLTEGTLSLDEYVKEHLTATRSYKDKHTKSMCKDGNPSALHLDAAFETWKASSAWQGGHSSNLLKINAYLNENWKTLDAAERQKYVRASQVCREALGAKRPADADASGTHLLVDETTPSKKRRRMYYSKETKNEILRKIQAAKEEDPKQSYEKLCAEVNINVRQFHRWKHTCDNCKKPFTWGHAVKCSANVARECNSAICQACAMHEFLDRTPENRSKCTRCTSGVLQFASDDTPVACELRMNALATWVTKVLEPAQKEVLNAMLLHRRKLNSVLLKGFLQSEADVKVADDFTNFWREFNSGASSLLRNQRFSNFDAISQIESQLIERRGFRDVTARVRSVREKFEGCALILADLANRCIQLRMTEVELPPLSPPSPSISDDY
jgi:hypothetical protein